MIHNIKEHIAEVEAFSAKSSRGSRAIPDKILRKKRGY